jgi:hypothetical protein
MNEVERLIVRRIAIEMKQRQCRGHDRGAHGTSIGRSRARRSRCGAPIRALHKQKRRQPASCASCRFAEL